jgi:RNA-binding protein PNO1
MELDKDDQKKLTEFETVNKDGKDIEFDKVQLTDLSVKIEHRRIPVPRHRFAPLKQNWDSILKTLVEHMKL